MSVEKFRGLSLACGAAMMLLAMPGEGKACCCLDGLFGGCCGGAANTTYAPPYAPTYAAAYPSCGSLRLVRVAVAPRRVRAAVAPALRDLCAADLHVPAADLLSHVLSSRGGDGLQPGHHVQSVQRLLHKLLSDDGLELSTLPGAVHDLSRGLLQSLPPRGELRSVRVWMRVRLGVWMRMQFLRQHVRHVRRLSLLRRHCPGQSEPGSRGERRHLGVRGRGAGASARLPLHAAGCAPGGRRHAGNVS